MVQEKNKSEHLIPSKNKKKNLFAEGNKYFLDNIEFIYRNKFKNVEQRKEKTSKYIEHFNITFNLIHIFLIDLSLLCSCL